MKFGWLALMVIPFFTLSCSHKMQRTNTCFQGKLVKRGICGQRVIQVLDQQTTGLELARTWTDSLSHRQYENVFTVANPCNFPVDIKEGDTFSFNVVTAEDSACVQCYAFTPVPAQQNKISTGCTRN
jgi:Cu/Ag efflux protein CusF